jgi:hypothetical protein
LGKRSLDALRYDIRKRAASRVSLGGRWTLTAALQRRYERRKTREAMVSMLVFGAAMALSIGAATAMGLV